MCLRRGAAAHTHQPVSPSAARMRADIAEMLEMLQARLAEATAQRIAGRFDQLTLPAVNTSERRPWWRRPRRLKPIRLAARLEGCWVRPPARYYRTIPRLQRCTGDFDNRVLTIANRTGANDLADGPR